MITKLFFLSWILLVFTMLLSKRLIIHNLFWSHKNPGTGPWRYRQSVELRIKLTKSHIFQLYKFSSKRVLPLHYFAIKFIINKLKRNIPSTRILRCKCFVFVMLPFFHSNIPETFFIKFQYIMQIIYVISLNFLFFTCIAYLFSQCWRIFQFK
jgi:hypothetical protein